MYVHEVGRDGRGLQVRTGDQLVIPKEYLRLSLNPLKGSGRFFRSGIEWFAKLIFLEDLPSKVDEFPAALDALASEAEHRVNRSPLLEGLDATSEADQVQCIEILDANRDKAEWWAFLIGSFVEITRAAIDEGNAERAAWAMACAERCRTMQIFKDHLEEPIWMGQSAGRIVELVRTWEERRTEADESFWQSLFNDHPHALTQLLAVPVIFMQDGAYVGGMAVDRREARFVDYLLKTELSRQAVVVEIKTPKARLLGSRYRRGVYRPSTELSGAIVQTLDYRETLVRDLQHVAGERTLADLRPRCVVIAGDAESELDAPQKRRSFELFRDELRHIEVVTFDEVFRKLDSLATVFGLTRRSSSTGEDPAAKL